MTGLSNLNSSFGLNGGKMFDFYAEKKKRLVLDHRLFNISQPMEILAFCRCFECHTMCFSHLGVKFKTVLFFFFFKLRHNIGHSNELYL